jgi:hypothetical protein
MAKPIDGGTGSVANPGQGTGMYITGKRGIMIHTRLKKKACSSLTKYGAI